MSFRSGPIAQLYFKMLSEGFDHTNDELLAMDVVEDGKKPTGYLSTKKRQGAVAITQFNFTEWRSVHK